MLMIERFVHVGIFDPALGGDPLLFQHMFWFYSHPAVYIMILPATGVASEVVAAFTRKRIFGYAFVAYSSLGIAFLGFLVWGHHMFVAGISVYSAMIFSFLSYFVAIPSAIKVFNWTATLYKGSVSWQTPMLYILGFIGLFTMGGMTGLFLAALGLNVHVTDTYFIVAHFHYIMVGGAVMAYFAGLHYWWPKITGRMYPEWWGRLGAVLAVGYALPLVYFIWSLRFGKKAGVNPWGAVGLEWTTTSPPPKDNFHETPVVTWDAYDYPAMLKAMGETQNL
jgi:cytochrome c oxidase subunit 1